MAVFKIAVPINPRMPNVALPPCPECGWRDLSLIVDTGDEYFVECDNCGCSTDHLNASAAVLAWLDRKIAKDDE